MIERVEKDLRRLEHEQAERLRRLGRVEAELAAAEAALAHRSPKGLKEDARWFGDNRALREQLEAIRARIRAEAADGAEAIARARLGVIESEREQAGAQRDQVVAALAEADAELGRLDDRLAAAASAVARARAEFDPAAAARSRAAEQQADEQARWWSRQPEWRRSSAPRHLRERIEAEVGRRASQRAEERERLRQEAAESWSPFNGPPS